MPVPPSSPRRPVVLCILDGVGWGQRDATDAVFVAKTPVLDRLMAEHPHMLLTAHGVAVGLPSDADMGNSEVGHNAMGAGRVIEQGAKLVDAAIESGAIWESASWKQVVRAPTVHFLGLVSDGNVHSHVDHLRALVGRAAQEGVRRIRVHALTDGRDVSERSAASWITPLERELTGLIGPGGQPVDAKIASGGGRMNLTMDRYEADWSMVARGWACHVWGEGRRFTTATEAVRTFYEEDPKVNDQLLPAFVCEQGPLIRAGDSVVFFNFRGDRAIEISRAFTEPWAPPAGPQTQQSAVKFDRAGPLGQAPPQVTYAGMMQYDGDLKIPANFLVDPPLIDQTVGEQLAKAGLRTLAVSETQKFGHVTYFFNGNRSGRFDETLETYTEVPSDVIAFDQRPQMKAAEIVDVAIDSVQSRAFDHVRLNLANGDMVGHTGDFDATVSAMETVDAALGRLAVACQAAGAILLVTADHGNADLMFELDKRGRPVVVDGRARPKTSHTLNPVPFILVDPRREWDLDPSCITPDGEPGPGITHIGATLLHLLDVPIPAGYQRSLVTPTELR
ncbi:MAG: 2,3-bisphosphoglycerate-independent phosphoglycerate mutase [Myxococcales bacterium]|nr:2,3-bisphosphoglycerate-independent phosphoglycerate mutase [Myxococcales bacterium]